MEVDRHIIIKMIHQCVLTTIGMQKLVNSLLNQMLIIMEQFIVRDILNPLEVIQRQQHQQWDILGQLIIVVQVVKRKCTVQVILIKIMYQVVQIDQVLHQNTFMQATFRMVTIG